MNPRVRIALLIPALAAVAALFLWGLAGAPDFGHYRGPYGDILNAVAVAERHVTNVVSAVTFDYRGFDTFGEEFILFASVVGVTALLRELRDEERREEKDAGPARETLKTSDAVRVTGLGLTGLLVLLGIYVVTHGHLTPGGGFQGGVIVATAALLVYLAGDLVTFERVTPRAGLEFAEAIGVAFFGIAGLAATLFGAPFMTNLLPFGTAGSLMSGGQIPALNVATGIAVGAGFILLLIAFLEQTLELRRARDE